MTAVNRKLEWEAESVVDGKISFKKEARYRKPSNRVSLVISLVQLIINVLIHYENSSK